MKSYFTADFFINNRKKLRDQIKNDATIIITANGLLQRNSDCTFGFRQDSSFWYLTGVEQPDVIAVLDKKSEYLILPHQEAHRATFDGATNLEKLAKSTGITNILDNKTGWKRLTAQLKQSPDFATLAPAKPYIDVYGFYSNPARAALTKKIKAISPKLNIIDIRRELTLLRMVKQPEELKTIRQAIDITTATLADVKTRLSTYAYEYQVEADISQGFRKRGAEGHAFTPIVAAGKNACTIHYIDNNSAIGKSRFILLDVGAEVNHYAADISHTYWFHPPTKREKAVFAAVKETRQFALNFLRPGVILKQYESRVQQFMGEKLQELGLAKDSKAESIRRYFPHLTSHHLGLDPHDSGDYNCPLEPSMVLTVEPGIYIPEEGIGIRIEDDVLITQKGNTVLSGK